MIEQFSKFGYFGAQLADGPLLGVFIENRLDCDLFGALPESQRIYCLVITCACWGDRWRNISVLIYFYVCVCVCGWEFNTYWRLI